MTGPEVLGPFRLPESVRAHLGAAEFASLWTAVSARLERNGLSPTGAVQLELDDAAAAALSGLLGRTVTAGIMRVRLAELDSALRSSRAAGGLVAVVEALTGPLSDRRRARQDAACGRATLWAQVDALLADNGLGAAWWVPDWVAHMRRSGILTRAGDRAMIEVSTAVAALRLLAETSFPQMASTSKAGVPVSCPVEWELGALATKASGWDAHALDADRTASDLVLRAAARVTKKDPPRTAADRRDLWTSIGVSPDLLSGTVLVWKLRPAGDDPWAALMHARADLGLVTHLTLHELAAAGVSAGSALPMTGAVAWCCENPQVMQAAARADLPATLLCLSGNPSAAGSLLLSALFAAGVDIRYHGDFDWPGIAIAGRIYSGGATPWRMRAVDYRAAIAGLPADRRPTLTGRPVATPWDPGLAAAMDAAGVAIHEESLLPDLLTDLH